MTTRMRLGVPVATATENNTYGFFILLRRYNEGTSQLLSTPTYSFGGFLWRADVLPKGKGSGEGIGCRLVCLGPDSREGVVLPHWCLRTLIDLVVVHPQKWDKIGVTSDELATGGAGGMKILSREIDINENGGVPIPLAPRDYMHRANHVLKSNSDGHVVEYELLCRYALLQPTLFSDSDYNVVFYVRIVMHDSFNLNQLPYDANAGSGDEGVVLAKVPKGNDDGVKSPKQVFLDALETRTKLVDKIALYDEKLTEASTEMAKKALRAEIEKISKALRKMTPLQHYFIT